MDSQPTRDAVNVAPPSLRFDTSLASAQKDLNGGDSIRMLSPRSEIERLKSVIKTKDACLLNFAQTCRAADEKALEAERRLQEEANRRSEDHVSLENSRLYVMLDILLHAAKGQLPSHCTFPEKANTIFQ